MRSSLVAALAAVLVLTVAGEALALDAWRDRRGLLFGVGIGAGSGKTDVKDADSHIGFNFSARIGGGVSKDLTLDADLGLHKASFEQDSHGTSTIDVSYTIFTGMIGANFFVYDGLYVRGMGGVANISTERDPGKDTDETGTGVGLGAGYEFFASADLAVGVGADYRLLFFDDVDFTMINFGVTGTWY